MKIRDYLYFTRTERLGILTLTVVCVAAVLLPRLYAPLFSRGDETLPSAEAVFAKAPLTATEFAEEKQAPRAFGFDPNTASSDDLQALGLPEKTVKSILNYRSKGGRFFKPEEFSKIYSLSEADFHRLLPWIHIGGKNENASRTYAPAHASAYTDDAPETAAALSNFDPNTVTEMQLQQMGLPKNTITGWLNYLSKGGKFRAKEDLQKLYALKIADFQRLLPYISIAAASPASPEAPRYSNRNYSVQAIDINSAEAPQWTQLPGIGDGWARKILTYRDKLGGFVSPAQVAETRNLPDSVFQKIRPYLEVHTPPTPDVRLNTATWEALNEHPYIDGRQARWIIAYREQHGSYRKPEDLLGILELKQPWLDKIKPYLVF